LEIYVEKVFKIIVNWLLLCGISYTVGRIIDCTCVKPFVPLSDMFLPSIWDQNALRCPKLTERSPVLEITDGAN